MTRRQGLYLFFLGFVLPMALALLAGHYEHHALQALLLTASAAGLYRIACRVADAPNPDDAAPASPWPTAEASPRRYTEFSATPFPYDDPSL